MLFCFLDLFDFLAIYMESIKLILWKIWFCSQNVYYYAICVLLHVCVWVCKDVVFLLWCSQLSQRHSPLQRGTRLCYEWVTDGMVLFQISLQQLKFINNVKANGKSISTPLNKKRRKRQIIILISNKKEIMKKKKNRY